jgi:hypothetical protein
MKTVIVVPDTDKGWRLVANTKSSKKLTRSKKTFLTKKSAIESAAQSIDASEEAVIIEANRDFKLGRVYTHGITSHRKAHITKIMFSKYYESNLAMVKTRATQKSA